MFIYPIRRRQKSVQIQKTYFAQSEGSVLYLAFKEKHLSDKIGLTKFCELRPKECVTVNNHGMHNVCVCIYHQNVKLMMHAVNLKESYIDLLQKLVCNIEN